MSEKGVIKKSTVEAICNAIRSKDGSTEPIPVNALANRITALNTDSEEIPTQEKTVDITENGTVEVTADEGYTLSKVTANVNVASSGWENKFVQLVERTNTEVTAQDLQGVTQIGQSAFRGYAGLISVTIPDNVTSIGKDAFSYCADLKTAIICNGVTSIGAQSFYSCSALEGLTIPDSVESIEVNAFAMCSNIKGATMNGIKSIGVTAFNYCSKLQNVTLGCGIQEIGNGAFTNCKKLESFTILADNPPSLGNNVFNKVPSTCIFRVYNLSKYREATNWSDMMDTYIFEEIPTASEGLAYELSADGTYYSVAGIGICTDTNVIIPDTYEGLPVSAMKENAFRECQFESVTIPSTITVIPTYAFAYCSNLTSVALPDGLTSINTKAFAVCTNLSSITIPKSVTRIGDNAFVSCPSLASVTFAEDSQCTIIDHFAFAYCTSLTSINIPDSVTSIGDSIFVGDTNLASVTIGSGVESIGAWAFGDCSNLVSVTVEAENPPTIQSNSFSNVPTTCQFFVYAVEAYKNATNWSAYADQIYLRTEG